MAFVSAGAYAREIDLSLYAETLTNTILAMAHTFNKGPIGSRTLVGNVGNLEELFGQPIDPSVDATACQGWFAAREYLKKGNQLLVTRVESAAQPAEYASMSLQGSSDDELASATDGVTSIPATRTLTSATGDFVNDGVLAGDVVEIAEGGADDGFYIIVTVAATVLTVDRDWPTGSLTDQDFTVWASKKEAKDDGATSAASTRTLTSATALFSSAGVAAGDIVVVNDAGVEDDNGVYTIITVNSETVITVDRDWPVGSSSALTFAVYGRNSSGADGSTAVDGEFSSAGAKFQDHGVKSGDILYVNDAVDTGDNGYYLITGLKLGSEDTTLTVNKPEWVEGSLTGLTYEVLPGSVTFQLLTKGTWGEGYYLQALRNASYPLKFDLEVKDTNNSLQLEKVFNMNRADVVSEMTDNSAYFSADVVTGRGEPATGKQFTVSGGDDGNSSIVDGDYIGNLVSGTGLYSFWNPEEVDINLVICPGISSQNVQDFLINLCETRGDCMTILDPPDEPTVDSVQDILDFTNGTLSRTSSLVSNYAAIYWSWQKVYDEFHDLDVWTAPSGHMAGVYAYNDNVQAPWFAPAGFKRGKLSGSSDVRYSPTQDDRDALYGPGACVNPIVNFTGEGIVAFGQKTCQRTTTALNRVNVRRMLLYVKKVIATAARSLVFDPNDAVLERAFKQLAEPVLDHVLSARGINEYLIQVATTDADRDNNRARFNMFIKSTTTAEVIEMNFIITSQGADFQELLAA